jgi:type II secretory ATPase GspE/PulE/Tfp pilus assembly ATPase PilB-like protein
MPANRLQARLNDLVRGDDHPVIDIIDTVLADAESSAASDVHVEPTPGSVEVKYRIDGVLRPAARLPRDLGPNLVARLKVLAGLLTYRTDVPQEGGIRAGERGEMRVSTFPTVHGEKAVIRLFPADGALAELHQLGLPEDILERLTGLLSERGGAVFLTGPSGSGKTTTIYACLQRLARGGGRHVVTIEDPVERVIAGVTQAQARPGGEFDFARGLRSLLRHDPDVIMVGEIRDRETAGVAIEAALTGHLVFSTLHAGSAAGVVGRLLDMGVEPYLLTSAIKGILNQRLLRRVCAGCVGPTCESCRGVGYRGRLLLAELLTPDAEFRRAILTRSDTDALEAVARGAGLRTIRAAAAAAAEAGLTTKDEVDRVLGPGEKGSS